ncbi:MAG: NAD-dependent DNA ligase LigA, partial [Bacteroidia bacterium]|nr:NAD-dependent DNA ligase LigA [Bacteroidia bacterium]
AKNLHSVDQIKIKTKDELTEIDEIGDRIADSIVEYFSKPEHINTIEFLRSQGLQFQVSEEKLNNRSDKLKGLSIIISGTFAINSRDGLKELIEQNGGKNVGSISKKTDYLLAGENIGPSKLEKATQLGIPIISEDDFLKMLE